VKQLTGSRGWEYAYEKALEEKLERLRDQLESGDLPGYQYLCGQIHGIRVAIKEMSEVRTRYSRDDDADLRE
jgi:hypothetical protein